MKGQNRNRPPPLTRPYPQKRADLRAFRAFGRAFTLRAHIYGPYPLVNCSIACDPAFAYACCQVQENEEKLEGTRHEHGFSAARQSSLRCVELARRLDALSEVGSPLLEGDDPDGRGPRCHHASLSCHLCTRHRQA